MSLRRVRLDNYEDPLAMRVQAIQRAFPDVATEIADAVYAYAGEMRSLHGDGSGGSSSTSERRTVAAKAGASTPTSTLIIGFYSLDLQHTFNGGISHVVYTVRRWWARGLKWETSVKAAGFNCSGLNGRPQLCTGCSMIKQSL